jgi:dGTP triphosphohydrolase
MRSKRIAREFSERRTQMFAYLMLHPELVPCDFIAGVTDRYFSRVYDDLFPSRARK